MLPPGARGNVSYVAPAGHYTIDEEVVEVDFQGTKKVGDLWCLIIVHLDLILSIDDPVMRLCILNAHEFALHPLSMSC